MDIWPYFGLQEVFIDDPKDGEQLAYWCGPSLNKVILLCTMSFFRTLGNCFNGAMSVKGCPNCNHDFPPADGNVTISSSKPIIQSISNYINEPIHLPSFSSNNVLGMTFICEHDRNDFHAKVIKKILDHDVQDLQLIKFLLSLENGELEEIISYNKISDLISEQRQLHVDGHNDVFGFHNIYDHQGPLKKQDLQYKGSLWNVYIHWVDGTTTWEPVSELAKFDPTTVVTYRT